MDPVAKPGDNIGGDTYTTYARGFFTMWCTRCHSTTATDRMGAPTGYNWDDETAVRAHLAEIRTAVGVQLHALHPAQSVVRRAQAPGPLDRRRRSGSECRSTGWRGRDLEPNLCLGEGNVAEAKDGWDKIDVATKVISALGSIAIPIALFVVGNRLSERQQLQSVAQLKADRVERMLVHLVSQNAEEKKLAVRVCDFLANQQQFPPELLPALTELATSDAREGYSASASDALQKAAQSSDQVVARLARDSLSAMPPRLNVHAPQPTAEVTTATANLAHQNVVVAVQNEPTAVPDTTELRYFRPEDAGAAQQMVARLKQQGITAEAKDLAVGEPTGAGPPEELRSDHRAQIAITLWRSDRAGGRRRL